MTKLILKNEHRFGPPRICAKIGIFADSHFPRLILSRAAAKPARDKINPAKRTPVSSTLFLYGKSGRWVIFDCSTAFPGVLSHDHRRRNSAVGLCRLPLVRLATPARPLGRLPVLAADPPRPTPPATIPASVHGADGCGAVPWEAAENRAVPVRVRGRRNFQHDADRCKAVCVRGGRTRLGGSRVRRDGKRPETAVPRR